MVRLVLFAVLLSCQFFCKAQAPDISNDPEIKWNGSVKSVVSIFTSFYEGKPSNSYLVTEKYYSQDGDLLEEIMEGVNKNQLSW